MRTGRGSQPPGLEVVAVNRQRRRRVNVARLTAVLRGAADALSVKGEVALVLAGDRALRKLNHRYRGKDRPTDVLSFPGPGHAHTRESLGDIVISVDTAAANAKRLGRTLSQEMDVLALHGFLHVLGYDHGTDDGAMERLERRLRKRLLTTPVPRPRGAGAGAR
jgi:probable rRNA maturation factor